MGVSIASFRITGLSPLLMNNPQSMARASGGIKMKVIPTPEEESKSKLYINGDGHFYLPTIQFRSSLIGACAGRRLGKVGAKSVVAGAVFVTAPTTTLIHPDTDKPLDKYEINIARAVIQHAGILRARPEFPKWACMIDFEVDGDFLPDMGVVAELMNIAGKIRGVGDWRPQKMGPYGRFSAEIVNNAISKPKRK